MLVTETEQLREVKGTLYCPMLLLNILQDLRTLEDNVEQSIERDEQAFLQESSAGDSVAVQRQMREQSAKLEVCH